MLAQRGTRCRGRASDRRRSSRSGAARVRELGLCLIAEAVDALAVRKVVFLTADHEHASLSREQEIHQTGARAAEGIVVRTDVAQSARLRQVGVESHDRDLGGQLHHPRAHTRILCRRQRVRSRQAPTSSSIAASWRSASTP